MAYDVAKNEKTAEALKAKKNEFINEVYRIVRVSLNDPNFGGGKVIEFFKNNQRALDYLKLGWIDINAPIDAETEHAMLHYAAKNENAELLQWVSPSSFTLTLSLFLFLSPSTSLSLSHSLHKPQPLTLSLTLSP